jgi:hypothetical protein
MNFADIENAWRSPHNWPSPAQLEKQKMQFVTDLKKRHRGLVAFLALVGVALLVITGKFAFDLIWPDAGVDKVDFAREWAIVPFLALPWIGWALLVRQYRAHRTKHPDYDVSIGASVRALLDENRMERSRYKLIAGLQLATLLVLPLVIFQLRAAGKAGDEILVPAFVIFPAIIAGILAASTWRYRTRLLPRKRELETLLASYQ